MKKIASIALLGVAVAGAGSASAATAPHHPTPTHTKTAPAHTKAAPATVRFEHGPCVFKTRAAAAQHRAWALAQLKAHAHTAKFVGSTLTESHHKWSYTVDYVAKSNAKVFAGDHVVPAKH